MPDPVVVMVVGASRSGTTVLDLMLGNRPDAFSSGEVAFRFRPRRRHQRVRDCRCGRRPCPVWESIGATGPSRFHRSVVDGLGVDVVVDSSKSLSWLIDVRAWSRRHGLRTSDVVIWKDPVDLAHSYWRRTGDASHWRRAFVSYYGRYLDLGLPFVAVRHADLVADPAGTLEAVGAATGIGYHPGQERFWEAEHHHAFGSDGPLREVSRETPAVRPDEPDPAFLEAWAPVSEGFADDPVVRGITDALVAGRPDGSGGTTVPRRARWYYKDRMIGWYRRIRPLP